jgi:membrane-associated phospholipid phosphatase
VAVAAVIVLALAPPTSATASGRSASRPLGGWVDVTLRQIAEHDTNPPRASRALALVSVAMERAARRRSAMLHAAAAEVLAYLFPDRHEVFRERAARLGGRRPLGVGRRIGAGVVRRARSDNSDVSFTGTPPSGPEYWEPTPPALAPPLEPAAGAWQPWNLSSGSALRPAPPPRPGDPVWERETREVYEVSRSLTADQRRTALYWADTAGTETPPGHWNRIAIALLRTSRLSLRQTARLFAVLNTAQADAFIAAWDAKFFYWSLRPVTAIRRTIDPDWTPLIPTPPFPGYVSGHAATSGAASVVLAKLLPRHARRVAAMARQAAVSRLYGGIHFAADNIAGLALGRRVGRVALRAYCGRPASRVSCFR